MSIQGVVTVQPGSLLRHGPSTTIGGSGDPLGDDPTPLLRQSVYKRTLRRH